MRGPANLPQRARMVLHEIHVAATRRDADGNAERLSQHHSRDAVRIEEMCVDDVEPALAMQVRNDAAAPECHEPGRDGPAQLRDDDVSRMMDDEIANALLAGRCGEPGVLAERGVRDRKPRDGRHDRTGDRERPPQLDETLVDEQPLAWLRRVRKQRRKREDVQCARRVICLRDHRSGCHIVNFSPDTAFAVPSSAATFDMHAK